MNQSARQTILSSIRSHLAASVPHDKRELELHVEAPVQSRAAVGTGAVSLVELFKQNLETVNGHCIIAQDEAEVGQALTRIISELQKTKLRAQRIAISDVPEVERLMYLTDLEIEALSVAPGAAEVFGYDVGITTAQAAIAETGTVVLDSADERHRLVSLVPPIHIAILEAFRIRETLADVLTGLQSGKEISPTVTFITGPSRTADIELTLAIGVHGPQELYVIVRLV